MKILVRLSLDDLFTFYINMGSYMCSTTLLINSPTPSKGMGGWMG